MEKKLYRSQKDQKIAGVCGGIAEYINIDPTIIRLLWVFFCFIGAGILAYIIAAIVIPEHPTEDRNTYTEKHTTNPGDPSNGGPESL